MFQTTGISPFFHSIFTSSTNIIIQERVLLDECECMWIRNTPSLYMYSTLLSRANDSNGLIYICALLLHTVWSLMRAPAIYYVLQVKERQAPTMNWKPLQPARIMIALMVFQVVFFSACSQANRQWQRCAEHACHQQHHRYIHNKNISGCMEIEKKTVRML